MPSFAYIYSIVLESSIIFVIFAVFFIVLLKYILTQYEIATTVEFATKQLKFYNLDLIRSTTYFEEQKQAAIEDLQKSKNARQQEVDEFNAPYEKKQLLLLAAMISVLAILLAIPIMLGWIKVSDINWKYMLSVMVINLVIILGLEATFVVYVIGQYSAIRFYPAILGLHSAA